MVSIKQGTASVSYSIMAALSRGFTGMVGLKRWASCNSGSNSKNERLCCDFFYDISILEGEATTLFRNVGIPIPIASYASRTRSSCAPIPYGLYLQTTDTLCVHGMEIVCGAGI